MICQVCGVEAATKDLAFHQNIGAVVVRFSSSVKGHLCKSCIDHYFRVYTWNTALLGWWGLLSCLMTPFILINNVRQYRKSLGMPMPPPGAPRPVLTGEAVDRLRAHAIPLIHRLNGGEDTQQVVADTARLAGVTPGQVVLFNREVMPNQARSRGVAPRADDEP